MVQDLHKICTLIDKLTIDSLTLMEKEIQSKLDLEKIMSEGETNLAKARYIMGHKNVSKLQLPSEDCNEFDAQTIVHQNEHKATISNDLFNVEIHKKGDVVNGEKVQNPLNWFGVLVPQNLHYAQEKFKLAVLYVIKSANIQVQLHETLNTMGKLKHLKELINIEE